MMKLASSIALVAFISVFFAPLAFADEYTSANFIAKDPVTNDFGGQSDSASFSLVGSGGDVAAGTSSSANFDAGAGPLFFNANAPKSQNWRWYEDENTSPTPLHALAAENSAPTTIGNLNTIKLRVSVAETSGTDAQNVKFRLQYSTTSAFTDGAYELGGAWDCTPPGTYTWCYADAAGTDNATITAKVLSDADACAAQIGNGCGTQNESGTTTSTFIHVGNAITEYEFTIMRSGTKADDDTAYFFRLFDVPGGSPVSLNTGETYPSLVTGSSTLSFAIGGLAASTVTEGVTTDIGTSASSVPFDSLPVGTAITAAQRFTISTNAAQGYKIYAYGRQGLLSNQSEIPPVTGTNESPVAWDSGCDNSATGCYGYHAGADLLSSGDTMRFLPDDKYAQFIETPKEVAFSDSPVSNETTDIVYKVIARSLQDAGTYESSVVYIVVPTFN